MFSKKKIYYITIACLLLFFIFYFGWGIFDYLEYNNYVEASLGSLQDGGKISFYNPTCVLDSCTPADPLSCSVGAPKASPCHPPECPCVTCAISCPCASAMYGPACAARTELHTISQYNTTFLTPIKGFIYKGGGTVPSPGMQYIYMGTPAEPWAIGIPSAAASRTQKLVDAVKYVIALFK